MNPPPGYLCCVLGWCSNEPDGRGQPTQRMVGVKVEDGEGHPHLVSVAICEWCDKFLQTQPVYKE